MFLSVDELPSKARAASSDADLRILIEDAQARAVGVAPCLAGDLTEGQRAQVVAVLRGAVTRAATADDRQMSAGPFSIGPAQGSQPRALLWPSEVEELQRVCAGRGRGRAVVGWLA